MMAEPGHLTAATPVEVGFEESDLNFDLDTRLNCLLSEARRHSLVFSHITVRAPTAIGTPRLKATLYQDVEAVAEASERAGCVKG